MRSYKDNTDLDYALCSILDTTIDQLDKVPLSQVDAMRTQSAKLVLIGSREDYEKFRAKWNIVIPAVVDEVTK